MKERHLKIFAAVFVLLLAIYFITKPRHQSINLDELVQNIIYGVAEDDVSAIEVYKNTGAEEPVKLNFVKQDEKWVIPTYFNAKAQTSMIESLISDLVTMTGKVRSSSAAHHEKFGITDNLGLHLILKDETGKALANIIIGRRPEDPNSSFVRFAGKDKVYFGDNSILSRLRVTGDVDTLTTFNAKSFVDLQAVKQERAEQEIIGLVVNGKEMVIKQIEKDVEVTRPDSTTVVEKQKEWVLVRGTREIELDQTEVTKFLNDVTSIRGTEVVDRIGNTLADMNKPQQYGTARPSHYLVFKKPGEQQQNVIFGKEYEKDKGRYMMVQYDQLMYKVNKSVFDKIFKWFEDLPQKTK